MSIAEAVQSVTRLFLDTAPVIYLIVHGHNTVFTLIDHRSAQRAAELRARYNLTLPDALQMAVALESGCDAFLTNDSGFKRVTELRGLILDELRLPSEQE